MSAEAGPWIRAGQTSGGIWAEIGISSTVGICLVHAAAAACLSVSRSATRAASQPYPRAIGTMSTTAMSLKTRHARSLLQQGERLQDRVFAVPHDHDQHREPQPRRGPDRLDRVLERAVPDDRDDGPVAAGVALGQRDPHRGREVPAQPAAGERVERVRLGVRPRRMQVGQVGRALLDQDGMIGPAPGSAPGRPARRTARHPWARSPPPGAAPSGAAAAGAAWRAAECDRRAGR